MKKWRMLNNLYLDPQEIGTLIARIKHYMAESKHKHYIPDIAMQFNSRRNVSGACLLNISLGMHQNAWHCFVTSRASELTCRWPMDLIFVNVFLREIGTYLKIDWTKIKINWHMISTYQSITSMPYYIVLAGREDWFEESRGKTLPSWQAYTLKRYDKCFQGDAYSNFGVQRRPMEAYKMLKGMIPRKCEVWTEDLRIGWVDFKGTFEDDYDETDLLAFNFENLENDSTENDLWGKGGYR
jgi:hypothetical protein